ncbi:MAG: hypothetical protein E6G94_10280 [Alphaproteobacteria bacterium]|nr:MAG: hypothetical protein E6G94_10280 [Alphaproteobacteria bacterium]
MAGWDYRREQVADWCRDYGPALAVILLATAVLVAFTLADNRDPPTVETAVIESFGTYAHERGDSPVVVVRMKDGSVRHLRAQIGTTRNCRKGDQIRLVRRSLSLTVHPEACLPHA